MGGKGEMKPTIQEILYSAKAILRALEQTDKDGTDYYEFEEAKILHSLIERYERKEDLHPVSEH